MPVFPFQMHHFQTDLLCKEILHKDIPCQHLQTACCMADRICSWDGVSNLTVGPQQSRPASCGLLTCGNTRTAWPLCQSFCILCSQFLVFRPLEIPVSIQRMPPCQPRTAALVCSPDASHTRVSPALPAEFVCNSNCSCQPLIWPAPQVTGTSLQVGHDIPSGLQWFGETLCMGCLGQFHQAMAPCAHPSALPEFARPFIACTYKTKHFVMPLLAT